ncbi:hypothetical protein H0H92_003224 [Tricholoma furcatifolium]|nr:hypothetical protein H0H92_003224 [Tricholoma furcatifolium]
MQAQVTDRGHPEKVHPISVKITLVLTQSTCGFHASRDTYDSSTHDLNEAQKEIKKLQARYSLLKAKYKAVKGEKEELQHNYLKLEGKRDALVRFMPSAPYDRLSVSCQPRDEPPPHSQSHILRHQTRTPVLRQEDYPKVKYWFKHEWTAAQRERKDSGDGREVTRGGARTAKGVNVMQQFIEDENGGVVDGFMASDIRKHARALWNSFADAGCHPTTWGKISNTVAETFWEEMRRRFPVLSLCHNNWKVEQIATDNYPAWHTSRFGKRIKEEDRGSSRLPSIEPLPSRSGSPYLEPSTQVVTPEPPSTSTAEAPNIHDAADSRTSKHARNDGAQTIARKKMKVGDIVSQDHIANDQFFQVQNPLLALDASKTVMTLSPINAIPPIVPPTVTSAPIIAEAAPAVDAGDAAIAVSGTVSISSEIPADSGAEVAANPQHFAVPIIRCSPPTSPSVDLLSSPAPKSADHLHPSTVVDAPDGVLNRPLLEGMRSSLPAASNLPFPPPAEPLANASSVARPVAGSPSRATDQPSLNLNSSPAPLPPPEASSPRSTGHHRVTKPSKKAGKMRPGRSNTARNLCAIDWVAKNPLGTTEEFRIFYETHLTQAERQLYEAKSLAAKQ